MATDGSGHHDRSLPGEPGIWLLIGGDLAIFSIFFLTFAYNRALAPETFAAGKAELDLALGLANTLLLLTGSLCVAAAVKKARTGEMARAARLLEWGAATGFLFLVDKAIEWTHLIASGIFLAPGNFAPLYFGFTGIHGLHVLIASVLLLLLARAVRATSPPGMMIIEAGGLFWHVVDLLWIMLFALFYLVG